MMAQLLDSQNIENVDYQAGAVVDFPEDSTVPVEDLVGAGLASHSIPEGAQAIQHVDRRPS